MTNDSMRMDSQEHALVLGAQRGDAAAFDRLARMHEEQVLRVLYGILGDRDDTYDAFQETLVRAFLRLDTFRFESSFLTWLTRIAINQALNARKKRRRDRSDVLDVERHATPVMDPGLNTVDRAEIRKAVASAMDLLSDRERAVFILRHHHEFRIREIAQVLDCAEGTVKNYLFRAIRKMRHALEPQYREYASA